MNHKTDMQALCERLRLLLSGDHLLAKTDMARATIEQAIAALASRPAAQADERGAFESWAKSKYGCSTERYELGGYKRMELNMWWETWQARAAAPQAQGVPEALSEPAVHTEADREEG